MRSLKKYAGAHPVAAASLLLAALVLVSPPVTVAAQEPGTDTRAHTVRRGDTLWDLAGRFYGDPFAWPCIHQANRQLVPNPHLILPEQRLAIPPQTTECTLRPVLGRPATGRPDLLGHEVREPLPPVAARPAEEVPVDQEVDDRTVFYPRPREAMVLLLEEEDARSLVPAGLFYTAPWLSDDPPLTRLGQVVQKLAREPQGGVSRQTAYVHDVIYLSYADGTDRPLMGERLVLIREERLVEGWGRLVVPRAIAQVIAADEDVMTAVVTDQFEEVAVGDVAVPFEAAPELEGVRHQAVAGGPQGEIVTFTREHEVYGVWEQAFIDLGRSHGVGVGDELVVVLPERAARERPDLMLPEELIATVRVVRVGENSSTVTVVDIQEPVLRSGLPVRLVRQMP